MYSKKVMEHFVKPKFFGKIENPDIIGTAGNPRCGDLLTLYLKIDKKTGKIKDIKFETLGCLPPKEEVLVNDGEWKEISSIREKTAVLNSKAKKAQVVDIYVRKYKGPILTFIPFISRFNQFSVTPEHPILCIKRSWLKSTRRSSNKCNWLRIKEKELLSKRPKYILAEDLKENDYLVFVPNKKVRDNHLFTKELMRLIGYYLAEGYITARGTVLNFSLNKNEKENISELKFLIKEVLQKEPRYRIRRSVIEFRISSKKWSDFFESLAGRGALSKKLSDEILLLPFEKQWEMIKTYIKGDGNIYRRRPNDSSTYRADTASRDLVIQIQEILARGGIFSSIKRRKDDESRNYIEGRKVSSNPSYNISFKLERKHKFFHNNGNYFLVPIRKIENKNYKGNVYNFQVAGKPNSYLVKGFAVHNCAAAIAASDMICQLVKGKTLEQALNISFQDVSNELGVLPPLKIHCAQLVTEALRDAINNYSKNL